MPRLPRIQFSHAIYHAYNRGNYRRPIFQAPGAAAAFEKCLFEAAPLFDWRLHAHVAMGNHFHLALETPRANLVEGMHWLQCTFATRFNRFRREQGHLFQGVYRAKLVEPGLYLGRLVNYIHLNPVRARICELEDLPYYHWSSLRRFLHQPRPESLTCADWLKAQNLQDTPEDWQHYRDLLVAIANDPARQKAEGFNQMTRGWAIGSKEWKREMAAEFDLRGAVEPMCGPERDALRAELWQRELDAALARPGRTRADLTADRKGAPWKVALADELRRSVNCSCTWLARELTMGRPASLRARLYQHRKNLPQSDETPPNA
jgi:putative transposase